MATDADTAGLNGQTGSNADSNATHVLEAMGGDQVVLPEGLNISTAEFTHTGEGLTLTWPDGTTVVIPDYFATETPPSIATPGGTQITAELATQLAGPVAPGQVAQAGPAEGAQPIGQVEKIDGEVTVTRADGTQVELQVGDPVFQGDILETGDDGAIGVILADETSFSMADSGRMVLDEMVYDPGTQEGSVAFSVVKGVFTFVSGEIAKTDPDAMTIATPVATIGIRGTQIGLDISDGENLEVVLMEEADGFVGEVVLSNKGGTVVLNLPNQFAAIESYEARPSGIRILSEQEIADQYSGALEILPSTSGNNANTYGQGDEGDDTDEVEDLEAALEDLGDTAAGGNEEPPAPPPPPVPEPGPELPEPAPFVFTPPDPEPEEPEDDDDDDDDDDGAVITDNTAETPQLSVSDISGDEDSAITLSISAALTDTDGSETLSVTISGVPDGATLSAGSDNGNGTWTVPQGSFGSLTLTPPQDYHGVIELTVTATATESNGNVTASTSEAFTVSVAQLMDDDGEFLAVDGVYDGSDHDINQHILGGDGDDTITTGTGDDVIDGGAGADTVDAGEGDDVVLGSNDSDDIEGGSGDDILLGTGGDDVIDGGSGDDVIWGGEGSDTLSGGDGDDLMDGGEGSDTMDGGAGDDVLLGSDDSDTLSGGDDDDALFGTGGDDVIDGGDGNDALAGGDDDDTLTGGEGDDSLYGGDGDDTAVMSGNYEDYEISLSEGGEVIVAGNDGTDTLSDIETITFSDGSVDVADLEQSPEVSVTGSGDEDEPINLNISVSIANPFATISSVTITGVGEGSTLSLNGEELSPNDDGEYLLGAADLDDLTLTGPENFNGSLEGLTVSVTTSEGVSGTSDPAAIAVAPVNDVPTNNALEFTINEDESLSFIEADLLAAAEDIDGDTLHVENLSADNGTLTVTDDGWTFTPDADWNGNVELSYDVTDGDLGVVGNASVTVNAINDAPVVGDDLEFSVNEDGSINLTNADLIANASDIDSDDLTVTDLTADNGTLTETDAGWTFTPDENWNGDIGLTYQVSDGDLSADASATITVEAINDAPILGSVAGDMLEDDGSIGGTLGATDVDDTSLTFALTATGGASNGTVVVNGDGSWSYTPDADFFGEDSFEYQVSDGHGGVDTATANITVKPDNDAPVLTGSVAGDMLEDDGSIGGTLSATDVDDTSLTFALTATGGASNGTVVVNVDGSWSYTPDADFFGEDSFEYQVSDGHGGVDTATANITVRPDNDAPEADDVLIGASAEDELGEDAGSVTGTFDGSDIEGDDLTFSIVNGPGVGSVSIVGGEFTYTYGDAFQTLGEGETAEISFSYQATDGDLTSEPANVTITVTGSNDGPIASVDLSTDTDEDSSVSGTLTASDVDSASLTYSLSVQAAFGTVTVNADGTFEYTPTAASLQGLNVGENATDSFEFQVTDGDKTSTATVSVNITGTNDQPVVTLTDTVTQADGGFELSLTGTSTTIAGLGASDIDNDASEVFYSISGDVDTGQLYLHGGDGNDILIGTDSEEQNWFTQDDIDNGLLRYAADEATGYEHEWAEETVEWDEGGEIGVNQSNLHMPSTGVDSVTVTFESESAGYHNSIGWYKIDADGNPTDPQIIWADASDDVIDSGTSVELEGLSPDDDFGFFLIQNGDNDYPWLDDPYGSSNRGHGNNDDGVDDNNPGGGTGGPTGQNEGDGVDDDESGHGDDGGSGSTGSMYFNSDGDLVFDSDTGGSKTISSGDIFYTSDASLNSDNLVHAKSGIDDESLMIGFEDTTGGGDSDFNDVIISVDYQESETVPVTPDSFMFSVSNDIPADYQPEPDEGYQVTQSNPEEVGADVDLL